MPLNTVCCNARKIANPATGCVTTCCKIIEAYVIECQYFATQTYATASAGLCTEGTMTNYTVTPAGTRNLHSIALDPDFDHSFGENSSIADGGCAEFGMEITIRTPYGVGADNVCNVRLLIGSTNPLLVRYSGNANMPYAIWNPDGKAKWTHTSVANGCKADLKLTSTTGTRAFIPFLVGGTEAATTAFVALNLSTV